MLQLCSICNTNLTEAKRKSCTHCMRAVMILTACQDFKFDTRVPIVDQIDAKYLPLLLAYAEKVMYKE